MEVCPLKNGWLIDYSDYILSFCGAIRPIGPIFRGELLVSFKEGIYFDAFFFAYLESSFWRLVVSEPHQVSDPLHLTLKYLGLIILASKLKTG